MNIFYINLFIFIGAFGLSVGNATQHYIRVVPSKAESEVGGQPGSQSFRFATSTNPTFSFVPVVMAEGSSLTLSADIAAIGPSGLSKGGHFRVGILDSNLRDKWTSRGWLGYLVGSWGIPNTRMSKGFFSAREMGNNGPWESIGIQGETYVEVLTASSGPGGPLTDFDRYAFVLSLRLVEETIHYSFKVTPYGHPTYILSSYHGIDKKIRTSVFDRLGFSIGQVAGATGIEIQNLVLQYGTE